MKIGAANIGQLELGGDESSDSHEYETWNEEGSGISFGAFFVPVEPVHSPKQSSQLDPTTQMSPTAQLNPTTQMSLTAQLNPTTQMSPTAQMSPTVQLSPTTDSEPVIVNAEALRHGPSDRGLLKGAAMVRRAHVVPSLAEPIPTELGKETLFLETDLQTEIEAGEPSPISAPTPPDRAVFQTLDLVRQVSSELAHRGGTSNPVSNPEPIAVPVPAEPLEGAEVRLLPQEGAKSSAIIDVDHPELGLVQLRVEVQFSSVEVTALTNHPAVAARLLASQSALRMNIARHGVDLRSVRVEVRSGAKRLRRNTRIRPRSGLDLHREA